MGTTRPVSVRAALNSSMIRARSLLLDPGGIRSSSWKVMPYAPSSASLCTASTAARTGRVASPNRSRACQPTVHRPKLNLSSRVGLTDIGVLLAGVGCVLSWGCVISWRLVLRVGCLVSPGGAAGARTRALDPRRWGRAVGGGRTVLTRPRRCGGLSGRDLGTGLEREPD